MARLSGRMSGGLTPWRLGHRNWVMPRKRLETFWREEWSAPEETARAVEAALRHRGGRVICGGGYDRWDLEVIGGAIGAARLKHVVEEHGAGRQLTRVQIWPIIRLRGSVVMAVLLILTIAAATDRAWAMAFLLGGLGALLALRVIVECGSAMARLTESIVIVRSESKATS
jgi:hypothetical protein